MRKNKLSHIISIQFLLAFAMVLMFSQCKKPASLNAVIISDQKGETNENIKNILVNTGLFDADIKGSTFSNFKGYDLVVLNVQKAEWGADVKDDFSNYVKGGGGVVVMNTAANAFADWGSFSEISGVKPGDAKSKDEFEYEVMSKNVDHPITKGLPTNWIHSSDYLLFNTKSLDGEIEVLASAKADTLHGGKGEILPVLFTVKYGEGRVFNTTMGTGATANQCVGFITTLQRGAEWAATGVVSQEVSVDFPNSVSTHEWTDFKPLTLDEILKKSASYEVGKSKKYLSDFSMRIRNCDGKPETYAMYEDKILEFLQSDATVDSKKYMCRELSWMGSEKSIPVLDNLINEKDMSDAASYALQRLKM